jgi:hypothetical protein
MSMTEREIRGEYPDFADDELENRARLIHRGHSGATTEEALERFDEMVERAKIGFQDALQSLRREIHTSGGGTLPADLGSKWLLAFHEPLHDEVREVIRDDAAPGYPEVREFATRAEAQEAKAARDALALAYLTEIHRRKALRKRLRDEEERLAEERRIREWRERTDAA